jgi:hypothetical protein
LRAYARARLRAVAQVNREHEPRTWSSWAITREGFAELADEVARIVTEETGGPTEAEIDVPGFERPFRGGAELLENVSESDWTEATSVTLTVGSGQFRENERLRLRLAIWPSLGATLSLSGRTRRSRNAIEPDVVAAIERHARRARGMLRAAALVLFPAYLLVVVVAFGLLIAASALGAGNVIVLATFSVAFGGAWGIAVKRLWPSTRRVAQGIEFLPDDRVSAWDEMRNRRWRHIRVMGSALVGVATVAAVIVSIVKD